ncbi:acetolactate synthase small subunit [Bacillus horti]|uniref:Acetolactate synthase small subunit n=1 Tax=Caldalkalibacillus horti TaxID=77523 RepID=A0ABT9W1X5_9BACI|nr:acetolactate synthase small subunit [Bacillus horti]MDQ0167247.1 acetolactate synthase-1/3 small subunit [Bacillus horti]
MRRIISVLVNNTSGVLARMAGLFARRGFNIESLTVSPTEDQSLSRITLVVVGDKKITEQMIKQLYKQIDVLKVTDLTEDPVIARELVLIKVAVNHQNRPEINHLVEPFRATIIDVGRESVTIQSTGDTEKNEALIELLRPFGIKEIARTGVTAMARSQKKSLQTVHLMNI